MKKIFKINLYIFTFILLIVSCRKNFLDINTDPNNPALATPALVFPSAVASSASVIGGQYAILGGIWSQYWTQSNSANQYKYIDAYQSINSNFDNQWQRIYSQGLNDYNSVIKQSAAEKDWGFYLMATVMQCYTYETLADLYDQIPFAEALQGTTGILAPHYDGGQQVYDSLIIRLDTALNKDLTAATVTNPGATDFLFGGNFDNWVQFAITLELKIYMRQIYARPDVAKAGLLKLYNTYGADFLTVDATMTQFVDADSKSNPLFEDNNRKLNVGTNLRASTTLLSFLQKNGDPRIGFYYTKANGIYKGLGQGDANAPNSPEAGGVDPNTLSIANNKATDPVQFISAAESFFLQAEALSYATANGVAITDPNGNTDADLYSMGVEQAFIFAGLTADMADSMMIPGAPYAYPAGTFEKNQEAIITQKWLSMPGSHSLEAFFEHNRTGYPKTSNVYSMLADHVTLNPAYVPGQFVVSATSVLGAQFPKRLLFENSERSRNPNTPPEVPITTKVWWDKK